MTARAGPRPGKDEERDVPYIERIPERRHVLLLLVLFVVLYLVNLGVRELRSHEALAAVISTEMLANRSPLVTNVHGERVDAFPLYPWLIMLCSGPDGPTERTARLPAALAILAMAALAGLTAKRAGGPLAGVVAASMVLTTVACLQEGVRASHDTVFALFLSAAWFCWYWLGRVQKRWVTAWFAVMLLVLAATFAGGASAFAYFYFPLFFLRRPLRGWRRMLFPAHFSALALVIGVVVCWLRLAPGQSLFPWGTLVLRAVPEGTGSYLRDVAAFPIECAGALLPWSFLMWPGFCMAYRPLEKNPVFCRFLRTLVWSLFLVAWFVPRSAPRMLLPLVCPIAVLTGLHYEILLRRHHLQLTRLCKGIAWLTLTAGGICLLGGVLHAGGLIIMAGLPGRDWTVNMLLLIAAVYTAQWLLSAGASGRPYWVRLLVAVAALRLAFLAVYPPTKSWLHSERRLTGQLLSNRLPDDTPAGGTGAEGAGRVTVYRVVDWFLVAECFYINRPVVKINQLDDELPKDAQTVYVLGGDKPPILPERTWTACGPPVDLRLHHVRRVTFYPGGLCIARIDVVAEERDRGRPPIIVRMYRGELR